MITRQALTAVSLIASLWACAPTGNTASTPTLDPLPGPPAVARTATTLAPSPTPASPGCLTQPGTISQDSVTATRPPQEFLIYLPPCYAEQKDREYPVLYLLHGQTFTDDQWVRMGAGDVASRLILTGETQPFIIVFPDDRYWNLQPGPGFGDRLIDLVIPYVDENYRTFADRAYRAIGGLSRGGGWAVRLGFTHPELIGAIGLHSPAVFKDDAPYLDKWMKAIPEDERPSVWLDIGDNDKELNYSRLLSSILSNNNYLYEFHVYSGDHTEAYWGQHVEEYLRWYTSQWSEPSGVTQ